MNVVLTRSAVLHLLLINYAAKAEENANPFTSLVERLPDQRSLPSSLSPSSSSPVFPVFARVLNAFPPSGVDGSHLSVVLDEDKIEGVAYGRVVEKETMMRAVEDFVIDFKNPSTGGVVDYGTAEYGYIGGEVRMGDEVVVIVRRSQRDPLKPAHHIKKFPTGDLSTDTSRAYLYNAVWNNNTDLPGLNLYKVNGRTGRLSVLSTGLLMGEGVEVTLPPGKAITIKASHADLTISHDSDVAHITEIHLLTVPGRRQYAVVLGDQAGGDTRALVMGPAAASVSGGSPSLSPQTCFLLTIGLSLLALSY